MLAAKRLLIVTVDGPNLGHALERLCNLAPLHNKQALLKQCALMPSPGHSQ